MFGETGFNFGGKNFGSSDVANELLYRSLPFLHRYEDEKIGEPLKKMFRAFELELNLVKEKIGQLVSLRDAYSIPAGEIEPIYEIVSLTSEANRTFVNLGQTHDFSVGSRVVFAGVSTTTPIISGLKTVSDITNTGFYINDQITLNGTNGFVKISSEKGSLVEVTSWSRTTERFNNEDLPLIEFEIAEGQDLSMLGVGYKAILELSYSPANLENLLKEDETLSYKVLRITRRTEPNGRNVVLCVGRRLPSDFQSLLPSPLVLTFKRVSLIEYLSLDFGVTFDDNDPPRFKRSAVSNVTKFLDYKSSSKGYKIRAATIGFDLEAKGLFKINGRTESIPNDLQIDLELANGEQAVYTSVAPKYFCFDDFSADLEGIDEDSFPLTDALIFEDNSSDGKSEGLAYSECIFECEVTSERAATEEELQSSNSPFGRVVVLRLSNLNVWKVSSWAKGFFSLEKDGFDYYIEGLVTSFTTSDGVSYTGEVLVGIPSNIVLPNGVFCLKYLGSRIEEGINCGFCPSSSISIEVEPTNEYIENVSYNGRQMNSAVDRVISKLSLEMLPIHARFGEVSLVKNVNATLPSPSVSIDSIEERPEVDINLLRQYDVDRADDVETDQNVLEVTIEIV